MRGEGGGIGRANGVGEEIQKLGEEVCSLKFSLEEHY